MTGNLMARRKPERSGGKRRLVAACYECKAHGGAADRGVAAAADMDWATSRGAAQMTSNKPDGGPRLGEGAVRMNLK
jgi:hypothetical protein